MIPLKQLIVSIALLTAVCTTAARADTVIIDQSNTAPITSSSVILVASPIGQEFTPTLTSLNFVDLLTRDVSSGNAGGTLRVNIRIGTIVGTIVGTSADLVLPDGFGFGGTLGAVSSFSFAAPVTLAPGSVYVIELVQVAGDQFDVLSSHPNPYAGGRMILQGSPLGTQDLYFVEGVRTADAIPEPATMLLLGTGLVGVAAKVGRRRRRL